MEENKALEQFRKKENPNWKEEDSIELTTLMGRVLSVNRILYQGPNSDPKKPKRCLSLTKNGKSVAFDIEMYQAVVAAIKELGEGFELK